MNILQCAFFLINCECVFLFVLASNTYLIYLWWLWSLWDQILTTQSVSELQSCLTHKKCIIFWYLFSVPFPWQHQVRRSIWTVYTLQVNYLMCLLFKSRICFYIFLAPSNPGNGQDGLVPVVMWHGMGDSCCLPFSMGRIKRVIFL